MSLDTSPHTPVSTYAGEDRRYNDAIERLKQLPVLDEHDRTPAGRLTWTAATAEAQRIANDCDEPVAVESISAGFDVIDADLARPELVCRIVEPQR